MARNPLAARSRTPHVSVLVTYRDAEGRQLPLPQAQTRESFTGLQLLTKRVLGFAEDSLSGFTQDFTIRQMGPSTFSIEVRAAATHGIRLRGRRAAQEYLTVTAMLHHLTDVIMGVSVAGVYLANHPDVRVRYVEDDFGPYYELFNGDRAVMAVDASSLEGLLTPEGMGVLCALVANLKQPGLAYATITQHTPGLKYVRRTQVATTDALRAFAAGQPLPVTTQDLAEARERARAGAASSSAQDQVPTAEGEAPTA
ncbi:hypothetical protein [Kocuria varians]|uniref:Uncharacterized protein n=1 Tax=Kocuria varians TaxID=1272 RepID=A0A7D7L0U6_KOCVA|nr:hypothetical protein [Kocuria varians]QMS57135.1 hypothetical protein CIB50_0001860 [Kocuria varians]